MTKKKNKDGGHRPRRRRSKNRIFTRRDTKRGEGTSLPILGSLHYPPSGDEERRA